MHYKKLLSTGILILLGFLLSVASISGDTYFSSKSGATFPVPDSWERLELSKDDREVVEAKFRTSNGDIVIFGTSSLYDYMTNVGVGVSSEQEKYIRKYRVSNSNITELFEDSADLGDYKFKTFKGVEWLYYETDILCSYQQAINGNLIIFMATVNISSSSRQELEEVISYVTEKELYKEEQSIKSLTETLEEEKQKELNEGSTGGIIVILISLAVIVLIPKERNAKCPVCGEKNISKNNYCKKCGNKMR